MSLWTILPWIWLYIRCKFIIFIFWEFTIKIMVQIRVCECLHFSTKSNMVRNLNIRSWKLFRLSIPIFSQNHSHPILHNKCIIITYLWFCLCRSISSNAVQEVPCFGGFISATGEVPVQKTKIDYYQPIHQPITEYETVYELLKRSEEATVTVGQEYTINTFDLGVCMKALPLIWKYPKEFEKHIVIPGILLPLWSLLPLKRALIVILRSLLTLFSARRRCPH